MDKKIFICSCNSLEHQMMFWYDNDDKLLFTEVHLINRDNIFKRIWYAIKYVFGHTSNYGAWDEFLFDDKNEKDLYNYLKDNYEHLSN